MSPQKPVLSLPKSTQEVVLDLLAIAGLITSLSIAVYAKFVLPEIIPVHFSLSGKPDGWGHKSIMWMFPILGIFITGGLTVLRNYPHTFNYPVKITEENASRQYAIACSLLNWLKTELIWLFASIEWLVLHLATSQESDFSFILLPVMEGVILATSGFYLRQAYLAR